MIVVMVRTLNFPSVNGMGEIRNDTSLFTIFKFPNPISGLFTTFCCQFIVLPIGPLHDPVSWHGINYTGTQITQRDFQNKGKSGWTGTSSFVLEVPV